MVGVNHLVSRVLTTRDFSTRLFSIESQPKKDVVVVVVVVFVFVFIFVVFSVVDVILLVTET